MSYRIVLRVSINEFAVSIPASSKEEAKILVQEMYPKYHVVSIALGRCV